MELLTSELLKEALEATEDAIAKASSPVVAKLNGLSAEETRRLWEDAPFTVTLSSPWIRAAMVASEARRRFLPIPQLSIQSFNDEGLIIEVSPGRSLVNADLIENVVVKRTDQIVRPLSAEITPTIITNALGAKREVARGRFRFPMEALGQETPIEIVCVGRRGNFTVHLSRLELSWLR